MTRCSTPPSIPPRSRRPVFPSPANGLSAPGFVMDPSHQRFQHMKSTSMRLPWRLEGPPIWMVWFSGTWWFDDEPNKMKRKSKCFGEIHRFSSFPNKAYPLLDGMILQIDHLVIYIARRAWNSTIIRYFPLHFFGGYILFLVQPCASSAVKHSPLEIHL